MANRAEEDVADHEELVRLLRAPEPDALQVELAARRHRMRTATFLQRQSASAVGAR